jgi:predicted Rossmann-fold nucleotide-binding protein
MHGYKACTVCGPAIDAKVASSGNKLDSQLGARGRKLVYGGGRDGPVETTHTIET